jgi:hypothetical protein
MRVPNGCAIGFVLRVFSTPRMTRAARIFLCLAMNLLTRSVCFLESLRNAQDRALTTRSLRSAANRAKISTTLRVSSASPRRLKTTVLTSAVRLHHICPLLAQAWMTPSGILPCSQVGPERYIAKQSTGDQRFIPAPSLRNSSTEMLSKTFSRWLRAPPETWRRKSDVSLWQG